jgi:hypothetical protein
MIIADYDSGQRPGGEGTCGEISANRGIAAIECGETEEGAARGWPRLASWERDGGEGSAERLGS